MAVMPADLDIYCDPNDPTIVGDIKVVKGTAVPIDVCDVDTNWAVDAGGTIAETTFCMEGAGALILYVPPSSTNVFTFTHPTSVDCSGCNWLRFNLYRTLGSGWPGTYYSTSITFHAHFWEAGGSAADNTMSPSFALVAGDTWYEKGWDLSNLVTYPLAGRNALKYFALSVQNTSATRTARVVLDYVWGDPGPSAIRAYDGTRVISLYPKVYVAPYEGTTAHQTISIPRKGIPSAIRTICYDTAESPMLWLEGFGTFSLLENVAGVPTWTNANEGIHNVTDGAFDLFGAATGCNTNGQTYIAQVMWED